MVGTTAALIAGVVIAGGAAARAATSRNSAGAPDYAAASREGVMADVETYPLKRMVDAAAKAGTQGTYKDAATGEEKVHDVTGVGHIDLSKIQLDYSLESADKIAKASLDLESKYGEQAIRQRLKELELSDPEGFMLRKRMGQDIMSDLEQGKELDDETREQVTEAERAAQALRGNVMGASSGAAEALGVGEAGLRLYQQRLANASAFLSGTTPVSQFSQISGAQQGAVAFTPQAMTPGIGINPNAGANAANYALGATAANQTAAAYNNAPWQTFLGSLGGAGMGVSKGVAGKELGYGGRLY